MDRGSGLTRSGPPKRQAELKAGGRLPFRSAKVIDAHPEREAAVKAAAERDGGCVLGLMARQVGVPDHWNFCSGPGAEGHEVKTRARNGSPYDPENIATLCRSCHAWVTAHAEAAEALGLILPSWATAEHAEEARRLRNRYVRVPFNPEPPSWRAGDQAWRLITERDLDGLWGLF
jgi:hypothetical protein